MKVRQTEYGTPLKTRQASSAQFTRVLHTYLSKSVFVAVHGSFVFFIRV